VKNGLEGMPVCAGPAHPSGSARQSRLSRSRDCSNSSLPGDNAGVFYLDLFDALARHDVRYVVVGGLALNLHGVERATMDVDLVVALDPPNLGAAIDAFETLGLVPVAPVKIDEARNPETLARWRRDKNMIAFGLRPKQGVGPTVDCLVEPAVPFAQLVRNAITKSIGAIRIPVASIDDLIALKRAAGRAVDLADIDALERLKQLGLDG